MNCRLHRFRLAAPVLFMALCLLTEAHATVINKSVKGGNSASPKITNTYGTPLSPVFPLFSRLAATPTYGARGTAFAYELQDEFNRSPEPKVDFVGVMGTQHTSQDTASEDAYYGNGGHEFHDWAKSKATFTGTPIGPGVSAGPVSADVMIGISALMELELETHEEGGIEDTFASATITDPFDFTGLTGDEPLGFAAVVNAGMTFTFDTGGTASNGEIRRTFSGSTDISGMEDLFTLVIAVGVTDTGVADMVVDFASNAVLGLDDALVTQAVLDAFAFNAASNTFTLMSDVTLYDAALPLPSGTTDFTLGFTDDAIIDEYTSLYQHVNGGTITGNVPTPHTLLLMALLPAVSLTRRRMVG